MSVGKGGCYLFLLVVVGDVVYVVGENGLVEKIDVKMG